MKLKVVSPFNMGSNKHNEGDIVEVDADKAKSLKYQGLAEDVKTQTQTTTPKKAKNKQQRTRR